MELFECKNIKKVSIIVATYRRDESLNNALESLINQSYKFIEIIVINDNADEFWNEKVRRIIKEKSKVKSIVYIENKINKGSAESRNIGVREATGEYITFLDDDDIYLKNKVKNQIEYMVKNNCDYCITDLSLYDENGKKFENRNRNYIKDTSKNELIKYHFRYHMTGTDTFMFKRNYFNKIGGFSQIDIGDEFYLMHKAIKNDGIFGYLPVCDVKAYIHFETDGLSSGDKKIKGENELYKYKKKYFDDMDKCDKSYIDMRHYAVLAFAELRRKKYGYFFIYGIKAFLKDPINSLRLISEII